MAKFYFTGRIAWAHHLFVPDEYNGVKKWKVDFYPDDMQKYDAAGLRLHKKDGEYGKFVRFNRDVTKNFPKKGAVEFEAPEVKDADGNPWPADKAIGNGSKATVKVDVYETRMGKGHRLEAVRIDELVEYKPEEEYAGDPNAAPVPQRELGRDEIPF